MPLMPADLAGANKGPASVSRQRLWSIREHVEFWRSRSRDPVLLARLADRGPNDRVIHFTWFTLIAATRQTIAHLVGCGQACGSLRQSAATDRARMSSTVPGRQRRIVRGVPPGLA